MDPNSIVDSLVRAHCSQHIIISSNVIRYDEVAVVSFRHYRACRRFFHFFAPLNHNPITARCAVMSPNLRPASAPSDLRNDSVEPEKAPSHQRAFKQWASTRGTRPDTQTPHTGITLSEPTGSKQGPSHERSPSASQSSQALDEAIGVSPPNRALSGLNEAEPWKRKTLLTLGTVVNSYPRRNY